MTIRSRRKKLRRREVESAPYELGYFARKHNITRDQARELILKIGHDRDRLNKAASKLFRRLVGMTAISESAPPCPGAMRYFHGLRNYGGRHLN